MLDDPIPAHVVHCRSLTLVVSSLEMTKKEEIRKRLVNLIKLVNPVTMTYVGHTFFSECLSMISEKENFTKLELFADPTYDISEQYVYHIEESCVNKLTVLHVDGGACGGKLANIAGLTSLNELQLEDMRISEKELLEIASLSLLKKLRVRSVYNDDYDSREVERCLAFTSLLSRLEVKLVELELSNVEVVNDDTMRYLKEQVQLKKLVLTQTVITDAGLEHISNLSELIELDVANNCITDSGLEHISNLSQLISLDVSYNCITDLGMKHLSNLTKLKSLNISHNERTGAGVKYLVHLCNLDELHLSATIIMRHSSFYQPEDPPEDLLPRTKIFWT